VWDVIEEAFSIAAERTGRKDLEILIIGHCLQTLPVFTNNCILSQKYRY